MKKQYYVVRTYAAGVFSGYIKSRKKDETTMTNARRLWYWKGAASLSQLAMEGVSCPNECKFPCEVDEITLLGTIEILKATQKSKESILSVPVWKS